MSQLDLRFPTRVCEWEPKLVNRHKLSGAIAIVPSPPPHNFDLSQHEFLTGVFDHNRVDEVVAEFI